MRKIICTTFTLASISLTALFLSGTHAMANQTNQIAIAMAAPSWELQDIDGKIFRSADFKGKVVVLDN